MRKIGLALVLPLFLLVGCGEDATLEVEPLDDGNPPECVVVYTSYYEGGTFDFGQEYRDRATYCLKDLN